MKRVRRLTVEIERRQVKWSMALSDLPPNAATEGSAEVCPHCGSPWMLLSHVQLPGREYALPELRALLMSFHLHVRGTLSGQLWICRKSFEQLKENI
jgi:hypothetical protein